MDFASPTIQTGGTKTKLESDINDIYTLEHVAPGKDFFATDETRIEKQALSLSVFNPCFIRAIKKGIRTGTCNDRFGSNFKEDSARGSPRLEKPRA